MLEEEFSEPSGRASCVRRRGAVLPKVWAYRVCEAFDRREEVVADRDEQVDIVKVAVATCYWPNYSRTFGRIKTV